MAKHISPDLGKFVDGNGNFYGTVPISGLKAPDMNNNPPILGIAQRIGVTGTEAVLPALTFYVPQSGAGTFGYLMVRGDSARNTLSYFRVAAFQNA